ncbi:NAD-dependent epimerase/dehydratase family protein [Erythrobacter sp.]|uniref:NAD-dependent epimerase/dehydratase family protein n=1 Tax=Erythrobacter sp. TaxID=1042 RepID=UPI0025ED2AD6|nr:NAD-dependent epimerase/dehydratase family protein [Erythrobacter sp.]
MDGVLVIGAAGFIGRNVVQRLLSVNRHVTAMDIKPLAPGTFHGEKWLSWAAGPADDRSALAASLKNCENVIYLVSGSLPATANAHLAHEVQHHVAETLAVAEFCEQHGMKSFVFSSSGGTVYGLDSEEPIPETAPTSPRNAYGVSKLAIEHYLRLITEIRSMRTISLRISNPYGIGQVAKRAQGFVAAAMNAAWSGETLSIWGDGSVIRDYLFVSDVADAISMALDYDGAESVMNIGSGKGYTQTEIIAGIEQISKRKIKVDYTPSRKIDVRSNVLSIERAAIELGWHPQTSLPEGLAKTWAWWEAGEATMV